jgi:tRNA pseudouridine38-40 synthase
LERRLRQNDPNRAQLLVRFGYDGARFRGLQPQAPGIPTAGSALRDRLTDAAGTPPKGLNFAARTDAGVHALKNLATCWFRGHDDIESVIARVSAPRDDGLVDVRAYRVPYDVHARGSGRGKRYRYLVEAGVASPDPVHGFVWQIAPDLDGERMRAAAEQLEGTHDYTSLRAPNCSADSAVKTLTSVRVGGPFAVPPGSSPRSSPSGRFVVEVCGNAFLRKMVRNLVGLLVEVGAGLREPDDVSAILAARDRSAAGLCAPPQGLVLVEVGCDWPPDGSFLIRELRDLRNALSDTPSTG